MAFHVLCELLSTISGLARFLDRGTTMALDPFTQDRFFLSRLTMFSIINWYSTNGSSNNPRTVPPDVVFLSLSCPTLTLGDLNCHPPTSNPQRAFQEHEIAFCGPYFVRATDLNISLLNTPGIYPCFSMSTVGRLGIDDPAFACPLLIPFFSKWSDPLPSTG